MPRSPSPQPPRRFWRSGTHGRRTVAAVLVAISLCAIGLPVVPEQAAAEPVTVPYIDRLGCGADDASTTPVFSWAGGGTASNGTTYTPTTAASAYPATTGVFAGVTGSPAFTTYSPAGYGSDFQYRGTGALGFAPVNPGVGATLTVQLPHPQSVQFTVGGVQLPSRLQISGSGPAGAVGPSAAARATAPGSATATATGTSAQVTGALDNGSGDGNPRDAVDVWFAAPVSTITLTLSTTGSGTDAGFLVTAPVACQSGTVSTVTSMGPAVIDAADGRVSHTATMETTVRNSSPNTGAVLYPSVAAPLRSAVEAQGMTLDSVAPISSSDAACSASSNFDGSGPVIDPSDQGLSPGEECTLTWTATVSMPQVAEDRVVDLQSVLRSSSASTARLKSQTSTPMTFPGLVSEISISDTGASRAQPGQQLARSVTVSNNGAGAAIGTTYTLRAPTDATLSDLPTDCTTDGRTAECSLGNIAPGGSATFDYTLVLSSSAPAGTTMIVNSRASSSAQAAVAVLEYAVTVVPTPVAPEAPAPPPLAVQPQRPRPPAPTPSQPIEGLVPSFAPTLPGTSDRVPVAMSLSFAGAELRPGTVSTLRGTLGPVAGDKAVDISLSGRVNQGMVYRLVRVLIDDEDTDSCVTQTREFSCTVTLQPGERAQLEVRLFTDMLNAPDQAIQQLALNTDDGSGDNTSTVTTAVASRDGESDTEEWISSFSLDMSTLDGAFLPLTAMMLLALAASVAERRRP